MMILMMVITVVIMNMMLRRDECLRVTSKVW
jgi:hypothetical protein